MMLKKRRQQRDSCFLIFFSLTLSLLSFIPNPSQWSNEILQNSEPVSLSFACVISSSIPMIAEFMADFFAKSGLEKNNPSDHFHLWERGFLLFGYVYPSVGYFVLKAYFQSEFGTYFSYLTNSQNACIAGSLLSLIHAAASEMWTLPATIIMIFSVGASSAITPYINQNYSAELVFYLLLVIGVITFLFLYYRTVLMVRRKGLQNLSSGEYFCFLYSSIVLIMLFVNLISPTIALGIYGQEITLVYTNYGAVGLFTLASVIPNRARQIRLESTEHSLEMKQAFVRYLSHEMRTPVNIILLGLGIHEQYLIEKDVFDSECSEMIADIKGAVMTALETLNEVLNYEKLCSKVMALDKSVVEPLAFVLNALSLFKLSAQKAGIHLILPPEAFNHPENDFSEFKNKRIDVDTHKMGQVLHNFVSNSLKFTPTGGTITVTMNIRAESQPSHFLSPMLQHSEHYRSKKKSQVVAATGGVDLWVEISVTDTGIGIAPENLPRVLDEIIQFNPNQNQGGNGSGLGMYISKGITELHGGRVTVHSDGLGKGTSFSVWLPVVPGGSPLKEHNNDSFIDIPTISQHGNIFTPASGRRYGVQEAEPHVNNDEDIECFRRESSWCDIPSTQDPFSLVAKSDLVSTTSPPPPHTVGGLLQNVKEKKDTLEGLKILMVDDSATNLKLCVKLFKRLGADVDSATDGCFALEMVRAKLTRTSSLSEVEGDFTEEVFVRRDSVTIEEVRERDRMYDVVVMDNLMPVMNGQDACASMRMLGYSGLIVGLTGSALPEDLAAYLACGATAVLTKPLVMKEFFAALHYS